MTLAQWPPLPLVVRAPWPLFFFAWSSIPIFIPLGDPCRGVILAVLSLPGSGGDDAQLTSLIVGSLAGLPALSGEVGGVGSGERVGERGRTLVQ